MINKVKMQKLELNKEKNSTYFVTGCAPELVIGIAAKNSNTTNYERDFGKIRKNEKYLMRAITGISTDKIFFLNQLHEDQIIKAVVPTENRTPFVGNADALITERTQFALVIRTADCVPVILYDKVGKILRQKT
jgi:copper oxidase (laccase) domain-containing protein